VLFAIDGRLRDVMRARGLDSVYRQALTVVFLLLPIQLPYTIDNENKIRCSSCTVSTATQTLLPATFLQDHFVAPTKRCAAELNEHLIVLKNAQKHHQPATFAAEATSEQWRRVQRPMVSPLPLPLPGPNEFPFCSTTSTACALWAP